MHRYSDRLHDLVDQYRQAETALNGNRDDTLTDQLNAAHIKALNRIKGTTAVTSSAAGAIAALTLAAEELQEIKDIDLIKPLIYGAVPFIQAGGEVMENAMRMADNLKVENISEHGWAAIYDVLSACITAAEGVCCQPRCAKGNSLNPAGEYLDGLLDFLLAERRRVMRAAEEALLRETRDRDDVISLVIRHRLDDEDFDDEDIAAMEAILNLAKARRGAHA